MNPSQWAYYHIFSKPPGTRTVLPIGQSILAGLIVFVLVCGIAIGIGFLSYDAGMGALVIVSLMALAFGYRSGMLAVLGAVSVALLPAALAVVGVDDYRKASRIRAAEVAAIDLASTPNVDVFVLKDFRVATELANVVRSYGSAGAPPQPVYYGVAPIVPAAWAKGQPIPAWLACTGSEESWCTTVLSHPLRAAARVDPRDYAAYRTAVLSAVQRFGLTAAAATLVLNHAELPADRAGGALTGMILMPILGFLVWLIAFLLWRAIKPAHAPARGG